MKYKVMWWVSLVFSIVASALVAFVSAWFLFLYVASLALVSYFGYQAGKHSNPPPAKMEE